MNVLKSACLSGAAIGLALALAGAASAESFSIPGGTLADALDSYSAQTGVALAISTDALKGVRTGGASGNMSPEQALTRILSGTGFGSRRVGNALAIVRIGARESERIVPNELQSIQLAQAASARTAVETVTVTSSKLGGADVQSIPISITALSQEQLTASQTNGGPDLVKQVPNLTFTKTNFTGYSIQIRGIGTQAISVTTDPAVAVAFNDMPFIRNHFFEQEFFDLAQVEVLRGPQGTLYGRNATAGVVNLTTAKPTDQFEAMASVEIGSYHQRRFEGMLNLPIVDDRLDIRLAGEWTKRQGYSFNELTNQRIDGRDLWSGRLTIGLKPTSNVQAYLVWEHFSEDDDRLRTSKQLCKTDPGPSKVNGVDVPAAGGLTNVFVFSVAQLSQGCLPTSLYSSAAFQVPNGFSLPYVSGLGFVGFLNSDVDPYQRSYQSRNLRVIESALNPAYKAKNDTTQFSIDYAATPELTFTSQTGFNNDFIWGTQDYNRFNTAPGIFLPQTNSAWLKTRTLVSPDGVFCDPQLGCSDRLVAQDLAMANSWQFNQEFRLASHFGGPFNFSVGANYLHYETFEKYYVFFNSLTIFTASSGNANANGNLPWIPGVSDNHECLGPQYGGGGYQYQNPLMGAGTPTSTCPYVDPNPIGRLNDEGHNYFLSKNPYVLNSYAAFGEVYYNLTSDLKLTGGLRFTEDRKHFTDIPSELLAAGYGYGTSGYVDQDWGKFTGRFAANWSPKLDFTDRTLVYASYAHGYKAGGANPPGASLVAYGTNSGVVGIPTHPLTFEPEYVDAFEAGSKNTLLDGALTLNLAAFYYNYKGYQISQIVDRTSVNLNFDAQVKGAEAEATWEPVPGLRFNFAGGWEDTSIAKGEQAIDLMDRTAGHSDWMVVKPFVTQSSNCVFLKYAVAALIEQGSEYGMGNPTVSACGYAYTAGLDPVTQLPYDPAQRTDDFGKPIPDDYSGYNPLTAPNNGEGFAKDLSGHKLPNAPPFTVSLGAQYSIPLSSDWAGTLRADYYWQDYSWARVFNDNPYDRLRGYTNVNLTLILTNQNGWQVMLYDKNVFNTTAITGTFLNSDDSGLTTNVFLTDPKLIGIRVTKNW